MLFDKIDDRYEQLMDLEAELTDEEQSGAAGEYQAGGIVVNLADDTTVYASLDSRLLARIMDVITPEEFSQMVDAFGSRYPRKDELIRPSITIKNI